MDQIIIEHYKNSCNFISLRNFKIPFIVDNGLYFNKEQVFKDKLEDREVFLVEVILINRKKDFVFIIMKMKIYNQKEIIKMKKKKEFGFLGIKMDKDFQKEIIKIE